MQDVWQKLVQLIIAAAQGLEMEDQTIQQAIVMLHQYTVMQMKGDVSQDVHFDKEKDEMSTLMSFASKALVCLMVSSKLQNREVHMLASNVRTIVQSFVNEAVEQQQKIRAE